MDVCYFQVNCRYKKSAAEKTAAPLSMSEKTKPSRFSVLLEGLTKLVSLASKLKNLIDLFK